MITTINRGGAENHLSTLVSEQINQGLKVKVVYLKGDSYWQSYFISLGVEVQNLGLKYYGQLGPLFKLIHSIIKFSPDILHAHMPPAELYSALAIRLARYSCPFLISKHNDEPFYKGPLNRLLGKWVTKKAQKIVAISNSVACYIHQDLQVDKKKIKTIYYGIDTKPYLKINTKDRLGLRGQWLKDDQSLVIGTVARLVPQKALHILLSSYAKYRNLSKIDSILVMVGSGPLEDELSSLAVQLGIEKNILWLGFREDIPEIINAFDVFALTSKYEGFGLVLLEAMAASTPVVASRVSAIPEIIKHDKTGYLCSPQAVDEFASAFLRLEDVDCRERLAKNGFETVTKNFTVSKMAEQTLELYKVTLKVSK